MITTSYIFQPLVGTMEIRVLHLASGIGSSQPIQGRLEHVNLNNFHVCSYEALSYEWGDANCTHTLSLDDGSCIAITESLYNALHDIRHQSHDLSYRMIWADGVCINQNDTKEREQQVAIMDSVYRGAKRVISYIGPENNTSSVGVEFAASLWQQDDPYPPEEDERWQAVRSLLARTWVSRAWCAQEFILNSSVTVLCGRKALPTEHLLADICQMAVERYLPVFCLPEPEDDPHSLRECHRVVSEARKIVQSANATGAILSLHELLTLFHALQATDPRDKIYSILSLSQVNLKVDYSCTVEDLYIRVAKLILANDLSLSILDDNLSKKCFKLPSWVPDWSTWQFGSHGTLCSVGFAAGNKRPTEFKLHQGENTLEIKGYFIDRINWLSDEIGPYYSGRFEATEKSEQRFWVAEQRKIFARHFLSKDSYTMQSDDILWRCLTGNITFDEEPADESYRAYFLAYATCTEQSSRYVKEMGQCFHDGVRRRPRYRRLCTSKKQFFGAVPAKSMIGDWICMFNGCEHLYVVREFGQRFHFVGHAYVDGLMRGEIF